MSDKKEIKEIDVASLDSELAAARTLEEGKGDKFIMMASVVAFLMTSFHIYTGFFGLFDYSVQRGVHLGFALTLILLTQPLYKHVFKDKFAGSKAFRAACRTFDMILVVLTWVSVWMAQDEVHHLTERLSKTTWMATFAGACLVIIVLECARRTLGYIMPVLALIFIFLGTMMANDLVWELSDMFNNLMVIPNVIALFALTNLVVKHADDPNRIPGKK